MSDAMPPAEDTGDTGDARQRRIEALRAIAHGQQQVEPAAKPPSRRGPLPRRKPRRARWLVAGAAVVCLAVIGGLALRGLLTAPARHINTPPSPPAMLTLHPGANGLGCPADVAWSPRGTSIAVLGSADCTTQGVVNLYRASDGKLTGQIWLDGAIQAALAGTSHSARARSTIYRHVGWSPDGKTLAVTFSVFFPDNPDTSLVIRGVALSSPVGSPPHVLIQPANGFAYYFRWDLSAGTGSQIADALVSHNILFATPRPALSYTWSAQGALAPGTPLPSATSGPLSGPTPLGNPIGDATFTVWQPGMLTLAGSPIGVYSLEADFLAWSPDGRYLVDAVYLRGRLPAHGQSTPSQEELSKLRLAGAPLLPLRDNAVEAVEQGMHDSAQVALAWRGNGIYVATQPQLSYQDADENSDPARHRVVLYDCFTGDTAGILTPASSLAPFSGMSSMLRWSPDGSHLLLYDPNLGTITIWGPSLLPKP